MEVSAEPARRRSRYVATPDRAPRLLTPLREEPLRHLATLGLLSRPQLMQLTGRSEKSIQRTMRQLFDAGLVEVVPLPRILLEGREDVDALFGSAPNIYRATRAGLRKIGADRPPDWGTVKPLFVAHAVMVRNVMSWLWAACRHHGLAQPQLEIEPTHLRTARPDGLAILKLPQNVLVGLIESDRGTERGAKHWRHKVDTYADLFASGELPTLTGYKGARILVVCLDEARVQRLGRLLVELDPLEARRYWLTDADTLAEEDLSACRWWNAGERKPLIRRELLVGGGIDQLETTNNIPT